MNGRDPAPPWFSLEPHPKKRVVHQRPGKRFAEIHVYDCLSSTNDLAAEWASKTDQRYWGILAHHQTQGKGQQGKTWLAQPGQSLLLSLALPNHLPWARPSVYCAWIATSLVALLCDHGNRVGRSFPAAAIRIKWPNDVLVEEKKIAGILIEQSHATIVGIGLNLLQTKEDFPDPLHQQATSLALLGTPVSPLLEVLDRFLAELETRLERMEKGDFETLEQEWIAGLNLLGRWVLAQKHGQDLHAQVMEIGLNHLVLRHPDGGLVAHQPEEFARIVPLDPT